MAAANKTPVIVVPVIDRPPSETFPNVHEHINDQKFDDVKDNEVMPEKRDIVIVKDDPDHYKDYAFIQWTGGNIRDDDKYTHFFSGFCNTMCTEETKRNIARHLALWDSKFFTELENKKVEYVVVVENDNVIEDITFLRPVLKAMHDKKIDILQMREIITGNKVKTELVMDKDHAIFIYTGGYDVSLSAYIIRVTTALNIVDEIIKSGGLSSGFYFEIARIENEMKINRQILDNAAKYVEHDPRLVAEYRFEHMKPNFWSRIGTAAAKRYPGVMYAFTTPLISFFGLFDINVIGLIVILFIMFMLIFNVKSKLLWFLTGTFVTAFI
ncbi:CPXV112 protein [Cowpox virus]|uniref:CPXV112 protein n=2 Tax=Cowpox virus TaxID=10243 RepID=Q8QMW4_CWPXB|nr:CPXV112 protein [Cowpox virus]AAM13555.1 CPXV112 protein [Cowpox virus]ARR29805.1 CPXV112 protein [Cowpox virus]ARR30011.1 CPXV112 protein [Cowpox virus]ARR30429.1 CPXV112 protein [Cowpox virus]ARR30632.1 CPXV112 protein [Cowpox virus]